MDFGGQEEWWTNERCIVLLIQILSNQQNLVYLRLNSNELSSSTLMKILSTLIESPSINTLREVSLYQSDWAGVELW